jgi:hypothetical protein
MRLAMTVRAQREGLLDRIIAPVCQLNDVVDLEIGLTVEALKKGAFDPHDSHFPSARR